MNSKISFFILLSIILLLALLPKDGLEIIHFPYIDKIKHFLAFFVLSLLFYNSFKIKNKLILLSLIALLIELSQLFTIRESSFMDLFFSLLGIVIYKVFFYKSS